ncbi:HAMP domain-containing histidine kinase [candidate division KSB1 bacterium]|nr:HAMP domain-containing histidine kinase [candidate division KSB1 bacterium]
MKMPLIRKLTLILIPTLVLPLVTYTAFQVFQRSKQQALIQSIYEQQLNSILFSINQNSWDRLNSWAGSVNTILYYSKNWRNDDQVETNLIRLMKRYRSIVAITICSDSNQIRSIAEPEVESVLELQRMRSRWRTILQDSAIGIERMFRLARMDYIRPLVIPWESQRQQSFTCLLIPVSQDATITAEENLVAGLFLSNIDYIEEIVARKIEEMHLEGFVFAIKKQTSDQVLYSTRDVAIDEFEQKAPLWVLPDLELLVKMQGLTLTMLSKRQATLNLFLLVAVNFLFLFGIFYLVRNMKKEMALVRLKTDFVANVSHELRTPLALIRMFAEMLEMKRVKSEAKRSHYLRTIMNESTRLTQLINNILDFARIDSHKKEYRFVRADIVELVKETLDMYRFHLEQKGFSVLEQIEPKTLMITMDRDAVIQALVNLLDNAVKFSVDSKRIEVTLLQEDASVHLLVKDYGIGIPESERKNIFEKFYRVESSLVHNTKGSGLGLALVDHIMCVHKGKVRVDSKTGQGSTFTLIFPIDDLQ